MHGALEAWHAECSIVLKMVTGQTRLPLVAKCTLDFRIVLSRIRF